MIAFFELECSCTAPEEVVFLVGSGTALGSWDTYHGIILETSPERFPWWYTTGPVVIESMHADFQFAISDRSLSVVRWEGLPYHRRLQCRHPKSKDGQQMEMVFRASWEDPKSTVTIRPSKLPFLEARPVPGACERRADVPSAHHGQRQARAKSRAATTDETSAFQGGAYTDSDLDVVDDVGRLPEGRTANNVRGERSQRGTLEAVRPGTRHARPRDAPMAGDLAAAPLAAARQIADDPGDVQTQWRMTSSSMLPRDYLADDAARHRSEGASFADVSGRPVSGTSSSLPSGRDFVTAGRGTSIQQGQGSASHGGSLQPGLLSPGVSRPGVSVASAPPAEAGQESRLTRDATIISSEGLPAPPPPTARNVNRLREAASGPSNQATRMQHAARASDGGTGSSPQRTRINRAADTIDSQESAEAAAPLQTASGCGCGVSAPPATMPVPIAPIGRGTTQHGSRFEYSSWEDARAATGEAEFLANSTHSTREAMANSGAFQGTADTWEPVRGSTANVAPNRAKAGVCRPAIVPQPPSAVPVHGALGDPAGRGSQHRDPATPPPTAAGSTDPTPAALRIPPTETPGSQGQRLRVQDYSDYSTQAAPGGMEPMEHRADGTRPQGSPQPESRAVPSSPQQNRLINSRQQRGAVGIAARSQVSVETNPIVDSDLRQSLSGTATSGNALVLGDVSRIHEYRPDDVGSEPDVVRPVVNLPGGNMPESQGLRSPLQSTRLVNSTQNRAGVAGVAVGSLAGVPGPMPANRAIGSSMPVPALPEPADDPTGRDARLEQHSFPAVASTEPDQDKDYRPDDIGPDRVGNVVNLSRRGTTDSRALQSPLQPKGLVNSPQRRSGIAARSFANVQPNAHADLRPSASPPAIYAVDVGVLVDDVAWSSAATDLVPANPYLTATGAVGRSMPNPATAPIPTDDPNGQDTRLQQHSFPVVARTEPDRGKEYQPGDLGPDRRADDAAAPAQRRVARAAEPALSGQHVGRVDGVKRPDGIGSLALPVQSAAASHLRLSAASGTAGIAATTGASPERLGLRSSLQRSRLVSSPQNRGVGGATRIPVGNQPKASVDLRQPASTAAAAVSAVSTGDQERRRRRRSPGSPGNPVSRTLSSGASSHAGNAIERPGTNSSSPASTPAADGGYPVDGTEARRSPVACSAASGQGARNSSGQCGSLQKGSGTNAETSNAMRGDGAPVSAGFSASQPENIRPNLALRKKAAGGPARRALSERPEPSSPSFRAEIASESVQEADRDEESAPGNSAEDRAEQWLVRPSQVAPAGAARSEPLPINTAFFEVECSETAPEEAVFLVLGHSSGGTWDINSGIMLETSPERFPCWSTAAPISVDTFSKIEFQFAISDRSLSQPPRFECMNCRRLPQTEGQDGQAYEIVYRGAWEDSRSTVTVRPSTLSPVVSLSSPVGPEPQEGGMAVPSEPTVRTAIMEGKGCPGLQSPGQCPVAADSTRRSRSLPDTTALGPEISQIPVVIVSSEILPWSNSGGLGRVTASLARQFALRGHRTLAISPMYTKPPPEDEFTYLGSAWVRLDQMDHEVRCMHKFISLGEGKGCDYVLLDHGCYQHRPNGLYCDSKTGQDYGDNLYRFAMLSLCALEVPLRLKFNRVAYGQKIAFISNDWQAALVSVFLSHRYRRSGLYRDARNIHIIHNLGFQGKFSSRRSSVSTLLGLGKAAALDLAKDGDLNLCKGAILCSDRVVTVSRNYAMEIQTTQGGFGLDSLLAQKARMLRFVGIQNALDDEWDPRTDTHLARCYQADSMVPARRECKAFLQKKLGLIPAPRAVLFGFVGRLTWQKGVDVLGRVVPWLLGAGHGHGSGRAQVILMGEGEHNYQTLLKELELRNRGHVCGHTSFSPILEHQMMAGCDFILMPSRYEPCGLPQLAASVYGAVPIVTATGGLKDSIRGPQEGDSATGFLIQPPVSETSVRQALREAMTVFFQQPSRFQQMQRNAMSQAFRWSPAIDQYQQQICLAMSAPAQKL